MSTLVIIVAILLVTGLVVYAADRYLDMVSQPFRNLICFVIILIGALAIANQAGLV